MRPRQPCITDHPRPGTSPSYHASPQAAPTRNTTRSLSTSAIAGSRASRPSGTETARNGPSRIACTKPLQASSRASSPLASRPLPETRTATPPATPPPARGTHPTRARAPSPRHTSQTSSLFSIGFTTVMPRTTPPNPTTNDSAAYCLRSRTPRATNAWSRTDRGEEA